MIITSLKNSNIITIYNEVLDNNNRVKLMPAEEWRKYKWDDFRLFCHEFSRYGIPTIEVINFLKEKINGRRTLEIGAGAGDLGYHLGIKMTDSKQQERPEVIAAYKAMRQPLIKYPKDVERREATDAVYKYKPEVVVASWITTYAPHEMPYGSNPYGVREFDILRLCETFILIGNRDTHGDKPIMEIEHEEYLLSGLVSRAHNQDNNRIWIWNRKHATPQG